MCAKAPIIGLSHSCVLENFKICPLGPAKVSTNHGFRFAGSLQFIGVQRDRSLRAVLEQEWRCGHSTGRVGVRLLVSVSFEHEGFGTLGDKQGRPVKGYECVPGDRDVPVATFAGAILVEVG